MLVKPLFLAFSIAISLSLFGSSIVTAENTAPVVPTSLTEYTFGTPSGDEVEMLELINRARSNPAAEGQRLVIALAAQPSNGGVDLAQLTATFNSISARPPVAFNANLQAAAEAHLADNYRLGVEDHNSPDGTSPYFRAKQFGYDSLTSENCNGFKGYNYPQAPWILHATYESADEGHRNNILEADNGSRQSEAGIGYIRAGAWNVEDFGSRCTVPLLTGAVFADNNSDAFYTSGEGITGTVVASEASTYYAVTVNGGYTLPLDLLPPYDAASPHPAFKVTFTATDGSVSTHEVELHRTVLADGWNYLDGNGQVRYDNAKADLMLPTPGSMPTPTPNPSPTPTPAPATLPEVTIASNAAGQGLVVTRNGGDLNAALVVTYKAAGTAVAGRDYIPLPGTKKIKANKQQARIKVTMLPGGTGSLKIKLTGSSDYSVGSAGQTKLRLSGKP